MKIYFLLGVIFISIMSIGCVTTEQPRFVEKELFLAFPEAPEEVEEPSLHEEKVNSVERASGEFKEERVIQTVYVPVFEEIEDVNPQSYFDESTLVYTFQESVVYQVVTTPNYITTIMLEEGEKLVSSPAAGDTERWIVGEAVLGEGVEERVLLYIKPLMVGLKTNYIIATNRRIYHLDLTSSSFGTMRSIRWVYPRNNISLRRSTPKNYKPTDIRSLQWDYVIEKNPQMNVFWNDIQVARDDRKTYIFFSMPFTQQEAPILFASSSQGDIEIINYRVYENCYVVDQVLSSGELRGGGNGERGVSFFRRGYP